MKRFLFIIITAFAVLIGIAIMANIVFAESGLVYKYFDDVSNIPQTHIDAIERNLERELVQGVDGHFLPHQAMTRMDQMVVWDRFIRKHYNPQIEDLKDKLMALESDLINKTTELDELSNNLSKYSNNLSELETQEYVIVGIKGNE